MAAGAILKIVLMAISVAMAYICIEVKYKNVYVYVKYKNRTPQAILPSKFNSYKIQDGGGRHFEILFIGHNSVIVEHMRTKFGTVTKNDVPKTVLPSDFTSEKIQDGGRSHFENWFNE